MSFGRRFVGAGGRRALAAGAAILVVVLAVNDTSDPLMLDSIDQTVLASYGMHRHRTAFTDALVRIRKQTSDTESDLCTGSCEVVTEAMVEDYCAGEPCSVVTFYDQGPGDDDITQATEDDQPWITDGSGNAYVCGSQNVPCMYFDAGDFQDCEYLSRADALGLSGNPGLVVYYTWKEETASPHDDGFVWAIGQHSGASYGNMANWAGAEHRMSSSTTAGNEVFLNPNDETFGSYESRWVPDSSIDAHTIRRNGSALTAGSLSDATPSLVDTLFVVGASVNGLAWFCPHGYLSDITLMATFDADDQADIEAAMQGWD